MLSPIELLSLSLILMIQLYHLEWNGSCLVSDSLQSFHLSSGALQWPFGTDSPRAFWHRCAETATLGSRGSSRVDWERERKRQRERERAQAGRRTRDTSSLLPTSSSVSYWAVFATHTTKHALFGATPCVCMCVCSCLCVCARARVSACVWLVLPHSSLSASETFTRQPLRRCGWADNAETICGASGSGSPELDHELHAKTSLSSGYFTGVITGCQSEQSRATSPKFVPLASYFPLTNKQIKTLWSQRIRSFHLFADFELFSRHCWLKSLRLPSRKSFSPISLYLLYHDNKGIMFSLKKGHQHLQ